MNKNFIKVTKMVLFLFVYTLPLFSCEIKIGKSLSINTLSLQTKDEYEAVKATVKHVSTHSYIIVENGLEIASCTLSQISYDFDNLIYPSTTTLFDKSFRPQLNTNDKVCLFLLDLRDGYKNPGDDYYYGYFYYGDLDCTDEVEESNEKEIIYLSATRMEPGSDMFMGTLAHEFFHMIHYYNDPEEYYWVDEGLAQLTEFICGYGHTPAVFDFIRNPGNNMMAWAGYDSMADYGQSYLFFYYLYSRIPAQMRSQFFNKLVSDQRKGIDSINNTISPKFLYTIIPQPFEFFFAKASQNKQAPLNGELLGTRIKWDWYNILLKANKITNFKTLYRDFYIACFVNDTKLESGQYAFDSSFKNLKIAPYKTHNKLSFEGHGELYPWSAAAIDFKNLSLLQFNRKSSKLFLDFTGEKAVYEESSNSFAIAMVFLDSTQVNSPKILFPEVASYSVKYEFEFVRSKYDKLKLIVINLGCTKPELEKKYAKKNIAAAFSYRISCNTTPDHLQLKTLDECEITNELYNILYKIVRLKPIDNKMIKLLSDSSVTYKPDQILNCTELKELTRLEAKFIKKYKKLQKQNPNNLIIINSTLKNPDPVLEIILKQTIKKLKP